MKKRIEAENRFWSHKLAVAALRQIHAKPEEKGWNAKPVPVVIPKALQRWQQAQIALAAIPERDRRMAEKAKRIPRSDGIDDVSQSRRNHV